jgi:hypothetical protein
LGVYLLSADLFRFQFAHDHGRLIPETKRLDERRWPTSLHRRQLRKGTAIPYISHLLAV